MELARLLVIEKGALLASDLDEPVQALGNPSEVEITVHDDSIAIGTTDNGFAEAHIFYQRQEISTCDEVRFHVWQRFLPSQMRSLNAAGEVSFQWNPDNSNEAKESVLFRGTIAPDRA